MKFRCTGCHENIESGLIDVTATTVLNSGNAVTLCKSCACYICTVGGIEKHNCKKCFHYFVDVGRYIYREEEW